MTREPEAELGIGADGENLIRCNLTGLLNHKGMTVTRLSELVGVSVVNLSILKNDHAKAIRFSTLAAICQALDCSVGDLLTFTRE
jgi:putative transcriptional regulator